MHLPCTTAQALFPAADVKLYMENPLSLLWDCHHGDTFVLKVGGLAVAPLSGEAAVNSILLELSLAPPEEVVNKIEQFAAQQNLSLAPWSTLPDELAEPLTLAACHLPEAKLFIFCETATLTARATPGGNMQILVTGEFKTRKVPCQETDLVLHLERAHSSRVLSYCFSVVRSRR
jgi:hypothetical protein